MATSGHEPIRVLHFADLHIGLESYGRTDPASGLSSRVVDFFARLAEIRAFAEAQNADLAIFAGDAFQTRAPSPTFQREFARFVRDLAALCPVVLLVGNHDLPASPGKAASIEIYHTLEVPNVTVGVDYAAHRIQTKRGPVQVATAPYPIPGRLLPERAARGMTIDQIDAALQAALEERLRAMAEQVEADPAPRVLAGHFSVQGARAGSERAAMLGRDVTVRLEALADPRWDYVALGHLHRHQCLTPGRKNAPPVVYSGGIERVDFSEEGDPKGFCWVELTRGRADWQFVSLDARPFVTIHADARASRDPTAEVLREVGQHAVQGAVVRVSIRLGEENAHLLRDADVRAALRQAGADHVAGLGREIERPVRARLGRNPEQFLPEELLARYFQGKDVPPERLRTLLDTARGLIERD
jgi:exonuclease SbcD